MTKKFVVEEVLQRIQELTDHLKLIRQEISTQVFHPETSSTQNIFTEAENSAQIISRFRASIDDVRHMLWLYIETASSRNNGNPEMQRKLLARATEILCALSLHPPLPKPDPDTVEGSFVERLLQFMETWIQEKMETGPESEPAAKPFP